jgi:putative membrane protein
MKIFNKVMCCAVLTVSAATLFMPSLAKADSTDDDKKFLATASQAGLNEIKLSELAIQKTTNPTVKAFAQKMVTEHKQIAEGLAPFADSLGVSPAASLDDDHQKEYDKLSGLSGNDFDKEYIDQMVTDHSKALSLFTSEAKDTKDAKLRATVLKDKTAIAAHKNMAYDLKKKL